MKNEHPGPTPISPRITIPKGPLWALGCFWLVYLGILGAVWCSLPKTAEPVPAPPPGYSTELFKAWLQVGVVSVIGTMISLLVFEYQRERQQQDREREWARLQSDKARDKERELARADMKYREGLLSGILSRATASYASVKSQKRLLRARTRVQDRQFITTREYDKLLETINEKQLELEMLARDVETSSKAFDRPKAIKDDLKLMEGYLRGLVREYERRRTDSGDGPMSIDELPKLLEFLQPGNAEIRESFYLPFSRVQRAIRENLVQSELLVREAD